MYLITGGGSGIGQALAWALAERGLSVIIVGRRKKYLQDTASRSSLIDYICADISTVEGMELIAQQLKELPSLKALINNAGTVEPITSLNNLTLAEWHHVFHTNLDPAFLLPKLMQSQLQDARVLNIGSGVAYFPVNCWSAYCTSKAALSMLTRCWQLESQTTAFASVMPGIIDTEMQRIIRTNANMELDQVHFYQRLKDHNRLVTAETTAAFLCWLLLDIEQAVYVSKEWDIYDSTHHASWLKPPHQVLHWDF